jgi:hypothetical protein
MAWEIRGRRQYFYKTKRVNGHVLKIYYGNGRRAQQAYEHDRQRQEAKARERAIRQNVDALDTETKALYRQTMILTRAAYLTHGYSQHRRSEWRRRRTHTITNEGDTMTITTTAFQDTPSIDTLEVLVQQAMAGDTQSLPAIRMLLDQAPTIWQDIYSLTKRSERAWIETIAHQDLITKEALLRQVAALKSTLEAESTSPLELLVIETICTCFLAYKQAELAAAEQLKRYGNALTQAQEQHLSACQKRYLLAIKELARIRQLLTPRTTTVLNFAHQQQVNVA